MIIITMIILWFLWFLQCNNENHAIDIESWYEIDIVDLTAKLVVVLVILVLLLLALGSKQIY